LRDALIDAGVDSGPARACSHAGVEMLFDGRLVDDETIHTSARVALDAVNTGAAALGPLAPADRRSLWVERLRMIGSSLDPARYRDARFVAERLHRMTTGRRRIELRAEHVDTVTTTLREFQPGIDEVARSVLVEIRTAVVDQDAPIPHLPG